jgi:hypothetical protein
MTTKNISMDKLHRDDTQSAAEPRWRRLYLLAGIGTAVSLAVIPLSMIAYFLWSPPTTVAGHFAAFEQNWLVGLLGMDLLYWLGNVLLLPAWVGLYVALRKVDEGLTAVAITLGLISIAALIAGRPILEMYQLSQQYATAATEVQQTIYLAAGEAILAIYKGTAFKAHYLLGTIALLIFSFVMLRSDVFSKRTAYFGIAANGVALGYFIPVFGVYISIFSVLFYGIWYFLIARRFFQLGHNFRFI